MAFRLVRRIRAVMLMVPACPESGSLGRAARPRPILSSAGLSFAGLSFAGPILAARFIASPAFARLRFIGPIFGSHVSKDYSRKSRFDKSSKHFFRENLRRPAALSGAECKPVTSAPPAPYFWVSWRAAAAFT